MPLFSLSQVCRYMKVLWGKKIARVGKMEKEKPLCLIVHPFSSHLTSYTCLQWPLYRPKCQLISLRDPSFIITHHTGLTLKTSDFHQLARNWPAVTYGVIAILLITPILALGAQALPLEPKEFSVGLAIFTVVPTTLGVGVALTQVGR